MRQTICQNCKSANKSEAIVCSQCGVKLAHSEQSWFNRMKDGGVFARILSAPGRAAAWLLKKIKLVLYVLGISLVLGLGFLFFLLFVPLSWPDYGLPPQAPQTHKAADDIGKNLRSDGAFAAELNPQIAAALGNKLLYPQVTAAKKPAAKKAAPVETPKKDAAEEAQEKLEQALREDKATVAVTHHDDSFFDIVVYGRLFGKLPWRLLAEFNARRENEGKMELTRFKLGNLQLPASMMRGFGVWVLRSVNPDEQLSAALLRIDEGSMQLRNNRDGHFRLKFNAAEKKKK